MVPRPLAESRSEVVELLVRRAPVLAALAEAPAWKPELVSALSVSRSTVDRAVRELESRSFVRRGDRGYEATPAGRLALAAFERADDTLAVVREARDLLSYLPHDAPLDPVFLEGASVHRAAPPAPRRSLDRLDDLVRSADRYRGFTTTVLDPDFVEEIRELVVNGEVEVDFVHTEETASYLVDAHGEAVSESVDADATMHVVDEVPYGLGVLEGPEGTHAYLLVTDEDATFRGLVLNDRPAAVEWAESVFERYRERARSFEP